MTDSIIVCSCPKCQKELQWSVRALGGETVCPWCCTHYEIMNGAGKFISGSRFSKEEVAAQ